MSLQSLRIATIAAQIISWGMLLRENGSFCLLVAWCASSHHATNNKIGPFSRQSIPTSVRRQQPCFRIQMYKIVQSDIRSVDMDMLPIKSYALGFPETFGCAHSNSRNFCSNVSVKRSQHGRVKIAWVKIVLVRPSENETGEHWTWNKRIIDETS